MVNSSLPKQNFSTYQMMSILRAQMPYIAKVLAIIMIITLVISLILPKTYTASSNVFIDYRGTDPISGYLFSSSTDESYLHTQIDILKSEAVAQRLITSLNLDKTSKYRESVEKYGQAKTLNKLIQKINENTKVETRTSSRVLEVTYKARTPEAARDYVNALVKCYIEFTKEISSASSRTRQEQYNAELDNLRSRANELQKKLTEAQQQFGIVSLNEQTDTQTQELNNLINNLNAVNNQLYAAQSKNSTLNYLNEHGISDDEIPDIAQLPNINDLKAKLSITNSRLSEAQSVLGSAHPSVIALMNERNELLKRIQKESSGAVKYQQNEVNRLAVQKKTLEDAIKKQTQIVMDNKIHRDTIASYQRELDSIDRVYNSAIQRYDEVILASNSSSNNIAILRPAQLPTSASQPVLIKNLAAGFILGVLISLCLALLKEFTHRKIRIEEDMTNALDVPLLGEIGAYKQEALS